MKVPPGPPREVCWGSWEATPPPVPPVITMVALQPVGGAVASTPAGRVIGYPAVPKVRIKGVGAGLGVRVVLGLGLGVPEGVAGVDGEGEGVLLISSAVPVRARSKVAALVAGLLK